MNIYTHSAIAEWHFLPPRREVWAGEWMVERKEGTEQGFFEVEGRTFVSGPGRLKGTRCPAELESGPPMVTFGSLGCRKLPLDRGWTTVYLPQGCRHEWTLDLQMRWGCSEHWEVLKLKSQIYPLWDVGTRPPWVSFRIWPKITQTFLILNI